MDAKEAKNFTRQLNELVVESDTYHKIRLDKKLRFFLTRRDDNDIERDVELELIHEPEYETFNGIYFDQNMGCGCGLGVDVYLKIKE